MKKIGFAAALMAAGLFSACGSASQKAQDKAETVAVRTAETQKLLDNLKAVPTKGIMFGHHDDTVYGIGWEGDEGRSDVQSVCGDYPAVISFDLGELELGGEASLDKVPFDKIRKEIVNQYHRGGLASLSWHARNPKTGGDAWDVTDTTVVKSILPGGANHEKFAGWLKRMVSASPRISCKSSRSPGANGRTVVRGVSRYISHPPLYAKACGVRAPLCYIRIS